MLSTAERSAPGRRSPVSISARPRKTAIIQVLEKSFFTEPHRPHDDPLRDQKNRGEQNSFRSPDPAGDRYAQKAGIGADQGIFHHRPAVGIHVFKKDLSQDEGQDLPRQGNRKNLKCSSRHVPGQLDLEGGEYIAGQDQVHHQSGKVPLKLFSHQFPAEKHAGQDQQEYLPLQFDQGAKINHLSLCAFGPLPDAASLSP